MDSRTGWPSWAQAANFQTAAQYQMYCALALLAVGLLVTAGPVGHGGQRCRLGLLVGSLIFSGSLYVLALTGLKWLGAITPIGGVAMLVGWAALAVRREGPLPRGEWSKRELGARGSGRGRAVPGPAPPRPEPRAPHDC